MTLDTGRFIEETTENQSIHKVVAVDQVAKKLNLFTLDVIIPSPVHIRDNI